MRMQKKPRIYISADIEGVAGVVTAQQGQPGKPGVRESPRTHD
jgi:D-aminopeptidase